MDAPAFSSALLGFSKTHNPERPVHLDRRYDTSGTFLPEPGNTVVCHVAEGSQTQRALIDARARYLAMPEAPLLAFTPVSSLHMTLFQGVIEYRRKPEFWPSDMALDMEIDETTERLRERLAGFVGGARFRMQVTEALPSGLTLEGVSAADRQALRDWRDALADVFGYRHPDHETYRFHITFAYAIERFEDDAMPAWRQMLDEVVEDIRARVDYLELNPPAFCAFNDMNHFEELVVLEPRD